MSRRILPLLAVAAAVALAGCQTPLGDGGLGDPLDTAQAKALLKSAADTKPTGKHASTMTATKDGAEVMRLAVVEDDDATYMEIRGDPAFFPADDEEDMQAGALFAMGFKTYTKGNSTVLLVNKSALAFGESGGSDGGAGGSMEAPGDEFAPDEMFENLTNATVKSVDLLLHNGKAAVRMVVDMTFEDQTVEATAIVYRDPARLARVTLVHPGENATDPMKGALIAGDFAYGGDVDFGPDDDIVRAAALAYRSDQDHGDATTTWTFAGVGTLPLTEVELHVKESSSSGGEEDGGMGPGAPDPHNATTLWSMKLSEGTKAQDGVTLTFADVDGDGKVSKGDTVTITWTGSAMPNVALYDTVTGVYVVPGAGLAALLASLAAIGVAARRR